MATQPIKENSMKKHYASELVGKTITAVRYLTEAEVEDCGWFMTSDPTCVISFADETYALIMADPEGNGPGFVEIGKW
jgi:hypothetical protein